MKNTLFHFLYGLALMIGGVEVARGAELAVGIGGAAAEEEAQRVWATVELPANFVLDLQTGLVANRAENDRPSLTYSSGHLGSETPLRLLVAGEKKGRIRIDRDGGEAVSGSTPVVGQELVFDCFEEAWGALRVLAVSPQAVTLEYMLEPDLRLREIVREPSELFASSGPAGVQLNWDADGSALFRIERRRVPAGPIARRTDWHEVARVGGTEWLDDEVALGYLTEYRVSRVRPQLSFGSTATGVAGIEPPDRRINVGPGVSINLLSAISDRLREDITVQYVRPNGVQILPGEGVEARMLTASEELEWVLPDVLFDGYRQQRFFVSVGRVLALRLSEGVYCLVRVEKIDGDVVTLTRQVDLSGERVFAPKPERPDAHWDAELGVVFEFSETRKLPPSGELLMVVERERTLDAGDWMWCIEGAATDNILADKNAGHQLLVRYRVRQGLVGQQLSAASEALTVLVGDDSDEARAAMLERAILDLGSDDYDKRGRARAVLVALGEDAWPVLRDSLRSDNVELAAAAHELLLSGLKEAGGDEVVARGLARLFLSIRAEELGCERPPHPDWTDSSIGARASAALRGLGWRETSASLVGLWRRVLAEADPEEAVRLCASLASTLEADGLGPGLEPWAVASTERRRVRDEWPVELDLLVADEIADSEPWSELVQAQARHELARARALSSSEFHSARERSVLARFLTAQFGRSSDDLFLDCALRLVEDPVARLRGAADLARSTRNREFKPDLVVKLEAPSTDLLIEELEALSSAGGQIIDFVLPAGIYEPLPGGKQIVIEGGTFRIRGEDGVVLHVGFTVMKGCDAVFENLSIVPESGIAINVVQSRLTIRDCLLRGGNLGLLGTDALLNLERSSILPRPGAEPTSAGIRFGGRSMLMASKSRIESEGVAIYGARVALFDRCVVISKRRNAIEGSGDSDLWLVNSLVKAEMSPFSRISRGLLEGAVLFGDVGAGLSANNGLQACAEHLRCVNELSELGRELWLERCSLGD
ncbi:MAG: hypothetical protein ACI8X5_002221 [Planctomycetota bacterium]|jgi:hypothetical protein